MRFNAETSPSTEHCIHVVSAALLNLLINCRYSVAFLLVQMVMEEKSSLTFSSSASSWPVFQKYILIFKITFEMHSSFFSPLCKSHCTMKKDGSHTGEENPNIVPSKSPEIHHET